MEHKFLVGDVCTFENHSITGFRGRDGQPVTVLALKPHEQWASTMCGHESAIPEYVIAFSDSHSFGCREIELKPITKEN